MALVNKTSFGIKQSHIIWFLLVKDKNLLQKSHDTCRIRVVEEDTITLKTDRVETRYLPLCSNPTEFGFKFIGILQWKSDKDGTTWMWRFNLDWMFHFEGRLCAWFNLDWITLPAFHLFQDQPCGALC